MAETEIYLNKLTKTIPDSVTKVVVPGLEGSFEFDRVDSIIFSGKHDNIENKKLLIEGGLKEVNYGYFENMSSIKASLFRNSAFESFNIPNNIKTIEKSVFRDSELKTLTTEAGTTLEFIESYAFSGSKLENFSIDVKEFEDDTAFTKADQLRNFTVPQSLIKSDSNLGTIRSLRNLPNLSTATGNAIYSNACGPNTISTLDSDVDIYTVQLITPSATSISNAKQINIGSEAALRGGKFTTMTLGDTVDKIEDRAFSGIELNSFNFGSVRELGSDTFKNSLFGVTELEFPETLQTFSGAGNFVGTNITKVISRNYEPISFTEYRPEEVINGNGGDFPLDMEFYVPLGTLIKYCPNTGTTAEWTEQGHGAKIFEYIHSVYNIYDGKGTDGKDIYGADVYFYITDTTSADFETDTRVESDGEVVTFGILTLGTRSLEEDN